MATGVPMVVESGNVELNRASLPLAYDSYAVIPKDSCIVKNSAV